MNEFINKSGRLLSINFCNKDYKDSNNKNNLDNTEITDQIRINSLFSLNKKKSLGYKIREQKSMIILEENKHYLKRDQVWIKYYEGDINKSLKNNYVI